MLHLFHRVIVIRGICLIPALSKLILIFRAYLFDFYSCKVTDDMQPECRVISRFEMMTSVGLIEILPILSLLDSVWRILFPLSVPYLAVETGVCMCILGKKPPKTAAPAILKRVMNDHLVWLFKVCFG